MQHNSRHQPYFCWTKTATEGRILIFRILSQTIYKALLLRLLDLRVYSTTQQTQQNNAKAITETQQKLPGMLPFKAVKEKRREEMQWGGGAGGGENRVGKETCQTSGKIKTITTMQLKSILLTLTVTTTGSNAVWQINLPQCQNTCFMYSMTLTKGDNDDNECDDDDDKNLLYYMGTYPSWSVQGADEVFFFFFFLTLFSSPNTSLWGFYSITCIHPLQYHFTRSFILLFIIPCGGFTYTPTLSYKR